MYFHLDPLISNVVLTLYDFDHRASSLSIMSPYKDSYHTTQKRRNTKIRSVEITKHEDKWNDGMV